MKRMLAFVVYTLGIPVCLAWWVGALVDLRQGWSSTVLWQLLASFASGVVGWWIVAGIAIRLGVFPVEYFRFLGRYLGLGYESPVPGARRQPQRPDQDRNPV